MGGRQLRDNRPQEVLDRTGWYAEPVVGHRAGDGVVALHHVEPAHSSRHTPCAVGSRHTECAGYFALRHEAAAVVDLVGVEAEEIAVEGEYAVGLVEVVAR